MERESERRRWWRWGELLKIPLDLSDFSFFFWVGLVETNDSGVWRPTTTAFPFQTTPFFFHQQALESTLPVGFALRPRKCYPVTNWNQSYISNFLCILIANEVKVVWGFCACPLRRDKRGQRSGLHSEGLQGPFFSDSSHSVAHLHKCLIDFLSQKIFIKFNTK